jgi:hypothetical protein
LAVGGTGAAAGDAGDRIPQWWITRRIHSVRGWIPPRAQ